MNVIDWNDRLLELCDGDEGMRASVRENVRKRLERAGVQAITSNLTVQQACQLLAALKVAHVGDPK